MAVGARVQALADIASHLPKTLRVSAKAIPRGTLGTVIQEDLTQRVVVVRFDNGVTGVFGSRTSGLPDTTELIAVVTATPESLL